jgi:hypothetical protein
MPWLLVVVLLLLVLLWLQLQLVVLWNGLWPWSAQLRLQPTLARRLRPLRRGLWPPWAWLPQQ